MDVAISNGLTRKLEERVSSVEGGSDSDVFSHFNHVTKNCLASISGLAELYEEGISKWEKIKKPYLTEASVLFKYLDLLENSPEFREKELGTKEGYFPEKFDKSNLEYVSYAWEQLNN
ncbi:hypothetical protein HN865_00635 [Candidatus Woesearchaeota archaeon]|jgi:hypothetical protein|nr:hypothetical protein [Candidatus Woesearchaeota archaeon]MBT7237345.1 hypothetical protein [Candidatus Woesearchaeota archaeon]